MNSHYISSDDRDTKQSESGTVIYLSVGFVCISFLSGSFSTTLKYCARSILAVLVYFR